MHYPLWRAAFTMSVWMSMIPQRHFSFFSHNLLKKGPESDPTCRDFGASTRPRRLQHSPQFS